MKDVSFCNRNKSLMILFAIDLLFLRIPILNIVLVRYTMHLYKISPIKNKIIKVILILMYVISICFTLYILFELVMFLFFWI